MNDINKNCAQLLQNNINDTKAQRTKVKQSIANAQNDEVKKYLESVNKALKASEELDTVVFHKVSSNIKKEGFVSKIAKFIKNIF